MAYNFVDNLDKTKLYSKDPIWEKIYMEYFPTMVNMTNYNQQLVQHQYQCSDRSLDLDNGQRITIEEKTRFKSNEDDFLLEYEVLPKKGSPTPGWIEKPLQCDYLVIHEADVRKTYLFPFRFLQLAWFKNKSEWISKYKTVCIRNDFNCCPVPKHVLFTALYSCTIINTPNES